MSWEQLISIRREAADELRAQKSQPPQACPQCGEPLISAPDGDLRCKFDGWSWRKDGQQMGA